MQIENAQLKIRQEEYERILAGWGQISKRTAPNRTMIPAMATLAGVRVGLDTVQRMERQLGAGYVFVGGHPHGSREWRSRQTGWYIDTDGFDYDTHGERVLDYVSVGTKGIIGSADIPSISSSRGSLAFLGCVTPGMTQTEVRRALEDKLPAPRLYDHSWMWTAPGYSAFNSHPQDTRRVWKATLTFQSGTLSDITVETE